MTKILWIIVWIYDTSEESMLGFVCAFKSPSMIVEVENSLGAPILSVLPTLLPRMGSNSG